MAESQLSLRRASVSRGLAISLPHACNHAVPAGETIAFGSSGANVRLEGRSQQCHAESGIEAAVRPAGKRRLLDARGALALPASPSAGLLPSRCRADQSVTRRTDLVLGMLTRRLPVGQPATAPGSTTGAALGVCSSARFLRCGPAFDLGTLPEFDAARAQVKHGLRHVRVAPLVLGDGVAVSEAKDPVNPLCLEKILGALSRYPSWT